MNPTTPGFRPRAIGLAALAALLTACSPEPAPVAPNVRPAYVVEVRTGGGEALEWAGEVRAARRAELGFAVAGRVAAVAVEVGDAVRAGQVLARLDEQPLRAQLAAAAAEQARAEAQQAEARQRWQRLSTARQAGAASAAEAGAAQAELATAEAALQAAQAQRALAAWQLEQATLRAPMAGVVGARQLEPGRAPAPGRLPWPSTVPGASWPFLCRPRWR
jgi:RND family efflux transporter MFP subunit